jgi:SHS family lactate transporter-like MFS transporter
MGGVWGIASASSMEVLPVRLRGIGSGVMNAGYPMGYLIAGVFNLALVPKVKIGYRALFYFAAASSFGAAIFRMLLPESPIFLQAKENMVRRMTALEKTIVFLKRTKMMMRNHWKLFIYCTLFMAGMGFTRYHPCVMLGC